MEAIKTEIEDWDLGAGIDFSFYLLRNSLQEDINIVTELVCVFSSFSVAEYIVDKCWTICIHVLLGILVLFL